MADVTSFQTPSVLVPHSETNIPHGQMFDMNVVSGDAANGDNIIVYEAVVPGKITSAALKTSATLGAGCTVQLKAGATNLTPATTAGAASEVGSNVKFPVSVAEGDKVQIAVAGANIAAAATISAYVEFVRA